jgi:hypothetical protein
MVNLVAVLEAVICARVDAAAAAFAILGEQDRLCPFAGRCHDGLLVSVQAARQPVRRNSVLIDAI